MSSILYIAQFFSTEAEPGGQGQRHFKHVNALIEDGHTVTVLTGGCTTMQLNMHDGVLQDADDTDATESAKTWAHPNLELIKLPTAPLNQRSVISRAKRYFAFSFKALMMGLRLILLERRQFQFVLGSSPPLLIALVAYLLAFLGRAEFYLEVRDLWSQTMAANGFINNRWALWINRCLESWLYAQASKIIIVSQSFAGEIRAQVPGTGPKIRYVPNGADMEFYQYPRLWRGSYLRETAADQALFQVNYAGVFSDYTNLETLLEVADWVRHIEPDIRFNLIGGGYQFDRLRSLADAKALENVKFWEALPKNRISKFIMEGDLSVINYRKLGIFGQVLPNKLFDYLAAGRPILAAVPEGEVSHVLAASGGGLCVEPENVEALVEKILWFYQHREQGLKMGLQGQRYVRRHFNRLLLVKDFLALFPRVIPLNPANPVRRRDTGKVVSFPAARHR